MIILRIKYCTLAHSDTHAMHIHTHTHWPTPTYFHSLNHPNALSLSLSLSLYSVQLVLFLFTSAERIVCNFCVYLPLSLCYSLFSSYCKSCAYKTSILTLTHTRTHVWMFEHFPCLSLTLSSLSIFFSLSLSLSLSLLLLHSLITGESI